MPLTGSELVHLLGVFDFPVEPTSTTTTGAIAALGGGTPGPQGIQGIQGIQGATGPAGSGIPGTIVSSNQALGTVSLASNVATNVTSISLVAGTWLLYGNAEFGDNTTTYSSLQGWLSATSASFPTRPNAGGFVGLTFGLTVGNINVLPVGMQIVAPGTTTTYFLSALGQYTGGTPTVGGFVGAIKLI